MFFFSQYIFDTTIVDIKNVLVTDKYCCFASIEQEN